MVLLAEGTCSNCGFDEGVWDIESMLCPKCWDEQQEFIGGIEKKLRRALVNRVRKVKNTRGYTIGHPIQNLGIDISGFRLYLEEQFTEDNGFTWRGWGSEWELDHVGVTLKDVLKEDDSTKKRELYKKMVHYLNLKVTPKIINRAKGGRSSKGSRGSR